MLFVCTVVYLTALFQWLRLYSVGWRRDKWMMNWKGCGRMRPRPNLRYYPSICMEGLRKTTKNLSQNSRCPGRDLNSWSPEYKEGVLVIHSTTTFVAARRRSPSPEGGCSFRVGRLLPNRSSLRVPLSATVCLLPALLSLLINLRDF
jgi:hypothetical protein